MKLYRLTTTLLAAACFFTSCAPSMKIVTIDVLYPCIERFPFVGKDVAIVGNLYYLNEEKKEYLFDSTLVAKAALGLKETLEQSPAFEGYEVPIYYTYTSDTSLIATPLTPTNVKAMTKEMEADMLIVVDFVYAYRNKENHGAKRYEHKIYDGGWFTVYEAGQEKPHSSRLFSSKGYKARLMYDEKNPNKLVRSVSDEMKAIRAYELGREYAWHIAPHWETVGRKYYTAPNDEFGYMRIADNHVQEGNWAKAMEYWTKIIKSSSKKKKVIMAAHNMAIGSEVLGDLNAAKEWLMFCIEKNSASFRYRLAWYGSVIAGRLVHKRLLDMKFQQVAMDD